jgi:hypothetical protein
MAGYVSPQLAQESIWALGNISDAIDQTKFDVDSWFLISQAMMVFSMILLALAVFNFVQ